MYNGSTCWSRYDLPIHQVKANDWRNRNVLFSTYSQTSGWVRFFRCLGEPLGPSENSTWEIFCGDFPVCRFKTSPYVPAPRPHVFKVVACWSWCGGFGGFGLVSFGPFAPSALVLYKILAKPPKPPKPPHPPNSTKPAKPSKAANTTKPTKPAKPIWLHC